MSLKVDPEFAKAAEPIARILASVPKAPAFDIESRVQGMAAFGAMAPPQSLAKGVEATNHQFTSHDGTSVRLVHLSTTAKDDSAGPGPCVLHFHGGGYFGGSVEMITPSLSHLVAATAVQIFSVDYRLTPAHQHPVPVEDGFAALLWLLENATKFNIDPARIALMGESSGGGLAASLALLARDRNLSPPLAKQILVYPMIDDRFDRDLSSISQYVIWDSDDNKTGWKALLGEKFGTEAVSVYAAPGRAEDVRGLPSTYMDIGSLDFFLEADLTYLTRLAAAEPARGNLSNIVGNYDPVSHRETIADSDCEDEMLEESCGVTFKGHDAIDGRVQGIQDTNIDWKLKTIGPIK
ncbi:Alpha/Beta hydrolase protein [Boeremia exigua]|uniref:Alpha/Beta hydrolase protein n=1 Tax=Boeremia exigua TaxID=749465 RepID=UPI001E8D15B4|nr:Alpha/Beta hydrolase protein [Boeremia exigua]KAH6629740.1 Alpha/Beta hydrolase protein [Boeremia exigua]